MNNLFVSVIVPIYKVEEYLEECVRSILNQTYQNFELILVDDASPDNCGKLCDAYAAENPKVKVIHKENGGLSSARNAGVEIARGEYIAFIDSDDYVRECYLEELVKLAQQHSADLVCCHFLKAEKFCKWNDSEDLTIYRGEEVIDHRFVNDVVMTVAWNKLYHRKFFEEYGLRYPYGKIHEDNFLTPQILYRTNCMVITGKSLYFYRVRDNSIVTSAFSEKRLDKLEAVEYNLKFYREINKPNLYAKELEGYLRGLMSFYVLMHDTDYEKYRNRMSELRGKLKKTFLEHMVSRRIKLKLKVKVILFLLKNR
ncbi:MAG: glycosyltransferase family 2 protein [Lachnospiraceae bacterium]|nr:glycosyltransferase family 2 protein [Lachnospiraceae bacterium]